LQKDLPEMDWRPLEQGTAEDAVNYFLEVLWLAIVKHIPQEEIMCKKSSHPWLNSRCRAAIIRKNAAENSDSFLISQKNCDEVLREERARYVEVLKLKLAKLPKRSKQWWRINRELLQRKANVSSIPPLRENNQWLLDAKSKANAFAKVFVEKSVLAPEVVDTPFFVAPDCELDDFIAFRSRFTKRLFKRLDESKATGHDRISAAILKRLADQLAMPFTRICRRMFYEGCWPKTWKLHLIVPIYKKGSAYKAGNYRGVHLTSILSKCAEKVVCFRLVPFLQLNAFGQNQWGFSTGLGAKDLVTMLVLSWIFAVCRDKKVGGYLGDISGAFDRVFKVYILAKLHAAGVGSRYLNFLESYLSPRKGRVVVQGSFSDEIDLENSIFQGTVLGPPLWNVFFADVAQPARSSGGEEAMFADDLNCFKEFDRLAPVEDVMENLEQCRTRVHAWGRANRVTFDAGKEHMVILHPSESHGECFKLLGCMIDLDLRMHSEIDQLLSKIRPKCTAILRTRAYYGVPDLISQYKTHIWGLVECNCGAYFHAASTLLAKIAQVQRSFLTKLDVTEKVAFLEFNFAPTGLRRDIAILGLLHKRVIGQSHPTFEKLLPFWSQRFDTSRGVGHNKPLYGHWVEATHHRSLFGKSIFMMVDTYNNLPQHVVDAPSVSTFQSYLTERARERCRADDPFWLTLYNARSERVEQLPVLD